MSNVEKKQSETIKFYQRKRVRLFYQIGIHIFAVAGMAILGAWAIYQMGWTKNNGTVDKNNRYLADVAQMKTMAKNSTKTKEQQKVDIYNRVLVLSQFYPVNADLIIEAMEYTDDLSVAYQMLAATELYMKDEKPKYEQMIKEISRVSKQQGVKKHQTNAIEWMNTEEWSALKVAIVKDKHLIDSAAALTGVEARLIVGCLVGEQIRLFNSKREMYKKYLGPVKVLSVQSQFSLGVNGIKDFTAMAVEHNLKDSLSPYYMGARYKKILDFKTNNPNEERITRLTSYSNHLYSYIYTGCILHHTKMQWQRAGYPIEGRPDVLFTLFNVGFPQSNPNPEPKCGGSHISVGDKIYTFGAIGFDFYYSGELAKEFPYQKKRFE